jgi:hypothetical protein
MSDSREFIGNSSVKNLRCREGVGPIDSGTVTDRCGERQRQYLDRLADREDAFRYDNSADVSTAVAEIAAEIER